MCSMFSASNGSSNLRLRIWIVAIVDWMSNFRRRCLLPLAVSCISRMPLRIHSISLCRQHCRFDYCSLWPPVFSHRLTYRWRDGTEYVGQCVDEMVDLSRTKHELIDLLKTTFFPRSSMKINFLNLNRMDWTQCCDTDLQANVSNGCAELICWHLPMNVVSACVDLNDRCSLSTFALAKLVHFVLKPLAR